MTRREFTTLLAGATVAWPLVASAQQPAIPVIGYLNGGSPGPLAHMTAAFLLMRIYAQDLKRPEKADVLLQTVGQRPHVPPVFVEYARRSIQEWSGLLPRQEKMTEGIESLLVARANLE